MAWQDRPYYRDRQQSGANPLWWLLTGSVPLGTWLGIRVRMHASMVILIVLTLIFAETPNGLGAKSALTSMTILFFSVLLHEFGHCLGARLMGGHAEEILMWPLGGLAYTDPPHRWWAHFITTAAGPFVNFAICTITGLALLILSNYSASAIPWFPFRQGIRSYIPHDNLTFYIFWIFLVNYGLLMFNLLLVFYPFDGGRLVQELLWWRIGYFRSMMFATAVGMVGAVAAGMFGIATWQIWLTLIAVFGFITCYRQRQQLREMGPEEWRDETDYSAAYETTTPRKSRLSAWSARRAQKRALKESRQQRREQQEIDAILAKVSAHGMHSLNFLERRALRRATVRQRHSDARRGRRI